MTQGPRIGPIHHVAIVVRSIEASLARYRELFDLAPEEDPSVFAAQRVRLCFLPTGPDPAAQDRARRADRRRQWCREVPG